MPSVSGVSPEGTETSSTPSVTPRSESRAPTVPAIVVTPSGARVPSTNDTARGIRSSTARPSGGMVVLGAVDIWIGWASSPTPRSASSTDAAVVQIRRSDGPSTRVSGARLREDHAVAVGQFGAERGLDAVLGHRGDTGRGERPRDVAGEGVDDAVLAVDGHDHRLVRRHGRRAAGDQDRQHDDHRGADEGAAAARRGGRLAGRNRREALGGQVVDVVRDDRDPLGEPVVEVLELTEQVVPGDVGTGCVDTGESVRGRSQRRTPRTRRCRLAAAARGDVDHVASRPRRARGRSAGTVAEAVWLGSTPTTVPALLGSGPTPAWR